MEIDFYSYVVIFEYQVSWKYSTVPVLSALPCVFNLLFSVEFTEPGATLGLL